MASNTAFISGFFRGIEHRDNYAQLLTSLYFVYRAMEKAIGSADSPASVKALDFPELRRLEALEEDMAYFYGPDWRLSVKPSPATEAYVQRIEEVAMNPKLAYLLVAHQYTRYVGDLFGGQMMGGMATKSLGLDQGKGA